MPSIPPSDTSRNLERLTTPCTQRLCALDSAGQADVSHEALVFAVSPPRRRRPRPWGSHPKSGLGSISSSESSAYTPKSTSDEADSPMPTTDTTSAMPSASNATSTMPSASASKTDGSDITAQPSAGSTTISSPSGSSEPSSSLLSSLMSTSMSTASAPSATTTVTTSASRSQGIELPEASSSSATPSHHQNLVAIVVPSVIVPVVVLGVLAVAAILFLRRRRRRRSVVAPPGESFLPEEGFVLRVVPPYGSSSTVGTSPRTTNPYSPVAVEDESTNSPSQASPWTSSPVSPHPFAYSPVLTEPADVPQFQAQWVPADDGHDRRPSYSNRRTMRLLRALADAEPLRTSSGPETETPLPDAK